MLSRTSIVFLLLEMFFTTVSAQKLTSNKILVLEPNNNEDGKFFAKFLDRQTMKIVEHWEMRSSVAELNTNIFNELMQKQKIYPDGVCYTFYPKMKLKSESHYEYGKKVGIETGFYPDRKIKYKASFTKVQHGVTKHFYPNGTTEKIENYTKGKLDGELKEFYITRKKKSIANYENGRLNGKYQSFYPDGTIKRKSKFKNDEEISVKYFDRNGAVATSGPFRIGAEYSRGLDALKSELDKFDFGFNKANTDTANFSLILDIDTAGIPVRVNYHFKHADTLGAAIQEWGDSLKRFSPTIVDGIPQPSYFNIIIAVSSDQIVWLGEPTLNYSLFNLNSEIEKRHSWFWEFPNPADEQVFFIVDNMPKFPGGDDNLRHYIANHIRYPIEAQKQGIKGKVYVSFIVDKAGFVVKPIIARSVHPLLDKEALRIVQSLPQWQPGSQRGKSVCVSYTVPINFAFRNHAFEN